MITKGDWFVELDGEGYPNIINRDEVGCSEIVSSEGFFRCDGSDVDNAFLCCKAKDLYKQLKESNDVIELLIKSYNVFILEQIVEKNRSLLKEIKDREE